MNTNSISSETSFSRDEINQQLQKILLDPVFAVSDILKRFLSFIVEETFAGHSNQLKEYTIGVKVLNKPVGFNPQQDAIVRIHAGRLRRALKQYYKNAGAVESIRLSIPKGSYVPVFGDNSGEILQEETETGYSESAPNKSKVIAVMPFRHFEKDATKILFADGLGVQLSTVLSGFKNLSIIAYYTMRRMAESSLDIKEIASALGAQYVITGDIQSQKERVRVNVQLINTETSEQVWSRMFEFRLTAANMFDAEDNIVREIVTMFEDHFGLFVKKTTQVPVIAVA
ncbi:MAG TPA: FlgO family outer membrane protein [Chitinophagaceae bacterium]|jgi:TolB-like protein